MKILVLNGSPKKKSDTMCMTNAFLEGLNGNGGNDIKTVNIIEKNIKPCLGCFGCWASGNGKCVQSDDAAEILGDIIESDIIILSFPLYSYSFPSHMKALIDRFLPLTNHSMQKVGDRVSHTSSHDFSAKHFVVISGCGFPAWNGNFDALDIQCHNLFPGNLTCVYVPEAPMFNVEQAKPVTEPLLRKFTLAGAEYASALSLSEKTVQELERPMIPQEVYLNIVNRG